MKEIKKIFVITDNEGITTKVAAYDIEEVITKYKSNPEHYVDNINKVEYLTTIDLY